MTKSYSTSAFFTDVFYSLLTTRCALPNRNNFSLLAAGAVECVYNKHIVALSLRPSALYSTYSQTSYLHICLFPFIILLGTINTNNSLYSGAAICVVYS
jgi:hypothetical protein